MQAFWNDRYAQEAYVYGTQPNAFFRHHLEEIKTPGRALFPAEGEGRNAVYAAELGWTVDAFDYSASAQKKALALADSRNVTLVYSLSSIEDFAFGTEQYDLIGLFFVHVPPSVRCLLHQRVMQALTPGGRLILEAFHPDQLSLDSGGPKKAAMLYSAELLNVDFSALNIQYLEQVTDNLSEGAYHQGKARLTRLLAQKKKN